MTGSFPSWVSAPPSPLSPDASRSWSAIGFQIGADDSGGGGQHEHGGQAVTFGVVQATLALVQ